MEALLLPLIARFIDKECPDCTSLYESDHTVDSCWSDESSEIEGSSSNHNQKPRLFLNAILLATSYAIACLFLRDGDFPGTLDTELVFTPSGAGSLGSCFEIKEWCETMLSIAAVGVGQKNSTKVDSGLVRFKKSLFQAVSGFEGGQFASPRTFGCFANGVSMVSLFLLQPMHSASYLAFEKQFGQLIDLPLDENGLIEAVKDQTSLKAYNYSPTSSTFSGFNSANCELAETQTARWDIEPAWRSSPQNIHFRCRLDGIPQFSFSPGWLQSQLVGVHHVLCRGTPLCPGHPKQQHGQKRNSLRPGRDEVWSEVPRKQSRNNGLFSIRLTVSESLSPQKRHYIFVKVAEDEFEQALALIPLSDSSLLIQKPLVERFFTDCLTCGISAARQKKCSDLCICYVVFTG